MKVVIDTNLLLSCVGKRSEYRNVFDTYLASKSDLLISNDKKLLALNDLGFPPVQVVRLEEFSEMLKSQKL